MQSLSKHPETAPEEAGEAEEAVSDLQLPFGSEWQNYYFSVYLYPYVWCKDFWLGSARHCGAPAGPGSNTFRLSSTWPGTLFFVSQSGGNILSKVSSVLQC